MRVTRASPGTRLARPCAAAASGNCWLYATAAMRRGLATAACCLLAAPSAAAEVKQARERHAARPERLRLRAVPGRLLGM